MEVLHAVVDAAKNGDMAAAKMLMDRVVPVQPTTAGDNNGKAVGNIVINIGKMQPDNEGAVLDAEVISSDE